MVLAMARPFKHPDTGIFWFRKRVPEALRELVGKREEKFTLGTRDPAETKARFAKASAEIESRWQNLRKGLISLSERQAAAMAGEIYRQMSGSAPTPDITVRKCKTNTGNELRTG